MATVATYIPYSELNKGQPSTLDQFQKEVGAFAKSRMLHLCSVMNAILRPQSQEEFINEPGHNALVKAFFQPDIAQALLRRGEDVRFVFHRQQILFVAKTSLLQGTEGGLIPGPDQFRRLGRVFLMAGDHLPALTKIPDPLDDKFAFLAAQFLPIQEASGFHRFDHKMARSYMMLSETHPKIRENGDSYFDIPKQFEQITNVPLLTFQSLLFGSLAKFRQFDSRAYEADPRTNALSKTWFASTRIKTEVVDRFLELVSGTPETFKENYTKADWGTSDFTPFRDRPFFRDGDYLFLIDFAFLAEKFETAPFWTVHNSLPNKTSKDELHAFWGRVFERYAADVIRESAEPKLNALYESPTFVDKRKGQVCDAIIMCGNSAAFIEFKGATFSSRAKYGSDYTLLKGELDKKLVREPEGEAKAVYQLKRAIELACDSVSPAPINGMDLSNIRYIFPVIITRDDIGSTFGVNAFLQVRFEDAFNRKSSAKIITPLFCLDAEDIERLSSYLKDFAFTDLLDAHYRANRKRGKYLLNAYFSTPDNEILKGKELRPPVSVRPWHKLTKSAADHLGLKP